MHLVLLGPPGAGKGTQAQVLSEALGVPHVATGDLFRDHAERGTALGQQASTYMRQGLLVPDEIVIDMLLERIGREDCRQGAVLDGFPRTIEQAQALDTWGVDRVLQLVVSSEELARRLGGRLVCRGCQTPYQREMAPEWCTACGGELYQREDDSPQAVRRRIEEYQTKTEPLVEYYRGQGKLRQVNGEQEVEAVSRDLLALVTKEGVSGA